MEEDQPDIGQATDETPASERLYTPTQSRDNAPLGVIGGGERSQRIVEDMQNEAAIAHPYNRSMVHVNGYYRTNRSGTTSYVRSYSRRR